MIGKIIDLRVWKANKMRPYINEIDKQREIIRKNLGKEKFRLIKSNEVKPNE